MTPSFFFPTPPHFSPTLFSTSSTKMLRCGLQTQTARGIKSLLCAEGFGMEKLAGLVGWWSTTEFNPFKQSEASICSAGRRYSSQHPRVDLRALNSSQIKINIVIFNPACDMHTLKNNGMWKWERLLRKNAFAAGVDTVKAWA